MRKVLFVLLVAVALIGLPALSYAQNASHECNDSCKGTHRTPKGGSKADVTFDYTKGLPQVAGEIEKTGVVEVTFYGSYHKIDKVVLRSESESIKLIHSAKHSMRDIEKMNGKKVSVRGKIRPVSRKHPEVAFEVIHLNEIQ